MATYGNTLGALLLGALLSVFLSGIVSMQVLLYFRLYPSDRARIKAIVAVVWLLDILHTTMIGLANWMYLVTHFGNNQVAREILWPISVTIAVTAVVTFLVHCFFTHRVYSLSKQKWYIATPIGILAALRVISAASCTAEMARTKTWHEFSEDFAWLFTTGLTISAVLDLMIAVALIFYLRKSRTGLKAMDKVIDTIVLYTLENGLLTSVFAILSLICWVTMSNNLIFLALHFAISKLYANSFLATLNARKTLQQRSNRSSGDRDGNQLPALFPNGILGRSRFSSPSANPGGSIPEMQISVEKTVQYAVTDVSECNVRFSDEERARYMGGSMRR